MLSLLTSGYLHRPDSLLAQLLVIVGGSPSKLALGTILTHVHDPRLAHQLGLPQDMYLSTRFKSFTKLFTTLRVTLLMLSLMTHLALTHPEGRRPGKEMARIGQPSYADFINCGGRYWRGFAGRSMWGSDV